MIRFILTCIMVFLTTLTYSNDCIDSLYDQEIKELNQLSLGKNVFKAQAEAERLLLKLEKENLSHCRGYFQTLLIQGFNYVDQIKLVEAQTVYQSILSNPDAQEFKHELARSYIENGLVHEWIKEDSLCHVNLDMAKSIIDEYQLTDLLTQFHVRKCSIYRIFGDRTKAKYHAGKAVEFRKASFDQRHVRDAFMLYGFLQENRDSVRFYIERNVDDYLKEDDFLTAATQESNLANSYPINSNKRKYHLNRARTFYKRETDKTGEYYEYFSRFCEDIQEYFEATGNVDSAYYYAKLHIETQDQFNILDNLKNVEANDYKFNLKQNELKLQASEKSKRQFQILSIIGFLTLLTFLGLLLNTYKNHKKIKNQNKEILLANTTLKETSKKNEVLLTEVHHRVKNNLQNIISLLHLQSIKSKDPAIQSTLVEVTQKINSIALIHDQLYNSEEFDKIAIRKYIADLISNNHVLSSRNIQFDNIIEDLTLNIETIMPLGIILSELLTNSVKHNKDVNPLIINIDLNKKGDHYYLSYKDNGQGYKEGFKDGNGIGLELLRILSRQLIAKLDFSNDQGAKVEMSFKDKFISKI